MGLEKPFAQARAKPEEGQGRNRGADIKARAALTTGQRQTTWSPGVLRILPAQAGKDSHERVAHGHYFRVAARRAGKGMGTFVTFRFESLKSMKNRAQSLALKLSLRQARYVEAAAAVLPSWEIPI